jgi:hypothetical protein
VSLFRLVRIVGFAVAFFVAFNVSQAATAARNAGETVPGIGIAIFVLALFFLLGAVVTEKTQGEEMNPRKDLLWGLSSGGLAIVAGRMLS